MTEHSIENLKKTAQQKYTYMEKQLTLIPGSITCMSLREYMLFSLSIKIKVILVLDT